VIDCLIHGGVKAAQQFHEGFARITGQGSQHHVIVRSNGNIVEGRDAADFDVASRFEELLNVRPRR